MVRLTTNEHKNTRNAKCRRTILNCRSVI